MQGSHEAAVILKILIELIGLLNCIVEKNFGKARTKLATGQRIRACGGQHASLSVRVSKTRVSGVAWTVENFTRL